MGSIRTLFAAVLAAVLAGCSTSPESGASSGNSHATGAHLAVLAVRTSQDVQQRRTYDQLTASAFFVRSEGMTRKQLLRLIGETDYADFSAFEAGQCTVRTRRLSESIPTDDGKRSVELLDAGDVTLELPNAAFRLASRPFPELVGYVSGFAYERSERSENVRGRLRATDGDKQARFLVSGSYDVTPLAVDVEIPRPLRIVEVGGRAVSDGRALADAGADLTLSWEPTGGPASLVVVEVSRHGYDAVSSVRCLVEDAGTFTIPGESLAQLARWGGSATDRVRISRITLEGFQTDSVADGIAVYVSEDAVLLR